MSARLTLADEIDRTPRPRPRSSRRPALDSDWRRLARWWPPARAAKMALDIAGNSRQWAAALEIMDRSKRLSLREQNQLLDTLALQIDAEREAAARALRARLASERNGGKP